MTISEKVVENIIKKLIKGEDYRIEVVALINAMFLQYTIDFFKKVIEAKLKNQDITIDWYKKEFLDEGLPSEDIAINSGLNKKTISNMYNTGKREIVIEASFEHYDKLSSTIQSLIENDGDLDITLTIKLKGVSVDLNLSESLIIINTLAVKRAAFRGGLWSTAGKRVEKPLMLTLCKLYNVSEENYKATIKNKKELAEDEFEREIDFYLVNSEDCKCEVKLMGKGNPESADAVIARDSKIFVADKLSDTNKKQLNSLEVEWVELRSDLGFRKFEEVLDKLKIPHDKLLEDYEERMDSYIFKEIFDPS